MKKLTSRLLAVTALLATMIAIPLATSSPAKANFVLDEFVFADLGATGFGNAPRLLTLQTTPETASRAARSLVYLAGATQFLSAISVYGAFIVTGTICTNNGNCNALDVQDQKSNLVNVTNLWTSGAEVGVGLDTNQTGSTGPLLFSELVMNIYSSTGVLLGTFGNNGPVLISAGTTCFPTGQRQQRVQHRA